MSTDGYSLGFFKRRIEACSELTRQSFYEGFADHCEVIPWHDVELNAFSSKRLPTGWSYLPIRGRLFLGTKKHNSPCLTLRHVAERCADVDLEDLVHVLNLVQLNVRRHDV